MSRRFEKKNRLAKDTLKIIKLGKKIKSGTILMYYLRQECPRLAIVASKKVGKSVLRNKLKRWVREIFRNEKSNLKNYGIVILYKQDSDKYSYCGVKKDIFHLWKTAGIQVES